MHVLVLQLVYAPGQELQHVLMQGLRCSSNSGRRVAGGEGAMLYRTLQEQAKDRRMSPRSDFPPTPASFPAQNFESVGGVKKQPGAQHVSLGCMASKASQEKGLGRIPSPK